MASSTIKRTPVELKNSTNNYSRHFNQMGFKGIIHKDNIFEVDQLSLRNAKNVYIDEDNTLISRNPIILEDLPVGYINTGGETTEVPIVPDDYQLVDMFTTGKTTLYISQERTSELYRIVARLNNSGILAILPELVETYHISVIEKYIIVFNNVDAVILDTDNFEQGWQLLKEVAEIPVIRRIIGQEVFENPSNQFTSSYKEEYIWSEGIINMLPEGDAEVVVTQSPRNLVWTLPNANLNTEFRILRSMGIEIRLTDIVTVKTNANTGVSVIAIARDTHVMLSLDNGESFNRILYPTNTGYLQIASLSEDALCFFFVAQDGVFRYTISEGTWTAFRITTPDRNPELKGVGLYNTSCFLNGENFAFVLYLEENNLPVANIYYKGVGLQNASYDNNTLGLEKVINMSNPNFQLNMTRQDISPYTIHMTMSGDTTDLRANIALWLPGMSSTSTVFITILGQGTSDYKYHIQNISRGYGTIKDAEVITRNPASDWAFEGFRISGISVLDNNWWIMTAIIGRQQDPVDSNWFNVADFEWSRAIGAEVSENGAPIDLQIAHILDLDIYSVDGQTGLPTQLNGEDWPDTRVRRFTVADGLHYYICLDNMLYTNHLLTDNLATITYTYIVDTPYNLIPQVSHVNNELYLGFGNTIMITANQRDGVDLIFNLPAINNHAFTSDITGMINISTTQVAIFLIDQIFLVEQVHDDLLGYRYDYFNTRLSTGVRLGDDIINTRDGVFTLYPTIQGLAVMNYQALMATTDQVVEYITKDILDIWTAFYNTSTNIKLVQMRDYVFLTNQTTDYLMLDLRTMSWWQFSVPMPVLKMVTDQFNLNVISYGLYRFDTIQASGYRDLYTKFIDWSLESQPLHFNAPNHYKNMRQLIFQFEEVTNIHQTIATQIKLYRKQITLRDPEIVSFKIDGYRTFIKRFNYWKINELQWALAADPETEAPAQLKLNGISIKYEQAEEVRS